MIKIISSLLLVSLLLSSVSCNKPSINTPDNTNIDEMQYYDIIIERYSELLLSKINNEEVEFPNESSGEIENAVFDVAYNCANPNNMGYATKDINKDGIDELILLNNSNKVYALFTIYNKEPVLLLTATNQSAAISPDGTVYTYKFDKDKGNVTQIKTIVDGTLVGLEYGDTIDGDSNSFYKIENGKRTEITGNDKFQLDNSIEHIAMNPLAHTKTCAFRFVSAIHDNSIANTSPVPDFSSYEGIIEAYRIIVESFSDYNSLDWTNGKFDALFNITDNYNYDVFHHIFYGGIRMKPTETYFGQEYSKDGNNAYGYAKKDLNGDGTEELLLLTDNYEIFAIFTMENGKAVLIENTFGAIIDENGYIRKSISTWGTVGRDAEVFVYSIDGTKLKTIVGVGYKVNIYLEKENWYKIDGNIKTPISNEEGEKLYAEYDNFPSGYSGSDYTRNFSGIEFIPLFESALASEKHVNTFRSVGIVNGDTLTINEISDNSVAFTFKNVYVTSKFDAKTNPNPEVITTIVDGFASRDGNKYLFDIDGIKGYIEFTVTSAWIIITESNNENVMCQALLLNYPED